MGRLVRPEGQRSTGLEPGLPEASRLHPEPGVQALPTLDTAFTRLPLVPFVICSGMHAEEAREGPACTSCLQQSHVCSLPQAPCLRRNKLLENAGLACWCSLQG